MTSQPRAAIYVRVSTRDQHLTEQFRGLRQEAERRGWKVVAVYRERESTRRERGQLARLLADSMMNRHDAILIWRLDRIGRSLLETYSNVQKLHERGIQVVSVRDGALDTSTPSGRLQLAMLCACAEYERELLRERTREGMARVRRMGSKSGKPIGRAPIALDLPAILERLAREEPIAAVARELGCSERTLRRRLKAADKKGGAREAA